MNNQSQLSLLDWRRAVAEMYAAVRHNPNPADAWQTWRRQRDELFRSHPQSPLDDAQRTSFTGLPYYEYDPAWRIAGELNLKVASNSFSVTLPEGDLRYIRIGRVRFRVADTVTRSTLSLFWLKGYGGGLFLPFADASNSRETYGGGRYLYDTIKGADLGDLPDRLTFLLDFNFAYNPSCAYNPHWVCPLAPSENRLPFAVTAGERIGPHQRPNDSPFSQISAATASSSDN